MDRMTLAVVALLAPLLLSSLVAAQDAEVPEPPLVEEVEEPAQTVDVAAVLRGEGRGLTADRAAALAIATAPSVERAQAAVRLARAGADRALYGFIPQLTLSARYTRLSEIQNPSLFGDGTSIDPDMIDGIVEPVADPYARELWRQLLDQQAAQSDFSFPILLNQYSFRAAVQYPLSDVILQVLPAYESAQSSAEAAARQVDARRRDVALNARQAFYGYARARGALAVARSALAQAESRHEQVQAFVQAESAAPVDELRIRAQVAAARVAVARAEAGVSISATALRSLLHIEPGAEVAVGEDLLAPLPDVRGTPEQLTERALAQRDDVRTVRRLIEAATHRVTAAEGSRYPHLGVAANLDVANPNSRVFPQTDAFRESWDVSAILSWSPHDLLNGERQADEARAQRDQARADLRALEDGVRLAVVDAAVTYRATREALDASRLGVEAADESYRVQMERYRAGASTVSDVVDASAEQVRAQLDLVNAAIDARVAHARLRRAVGDEE